MVDDFLRSLPAGAVGLDVGCGNGKYLTVNKDVFIIASDRYVDNFAARWIWLTRLEVKSSHRDRGSTSAA